MTFVIANVKFLLDQLSHPGTSPQRSLIAEPLRTCDQVLLTALAASHSSAACGRRVPLGAARTSPGCDSRAPSGIRSVGPRGVDAQSPLVSVRVPIIVWLESGVSPRHQNREALQQGFPYLVRRSISEKGPLYYARFNRMSSPRGELSWPNARSPTTKRTAAANIITGS